MKNLSFWAQSLDNQAPDIIINDRQVLSDDESRQKIVSEIYKLPTKDIKISSYDSSVTVRYSHPRFVIEVIPAEKDRVNRLAPIIIYGQFPKECPSDWVNNVCNEIKEVVSNQIKRTLQDGTLESIRDWLIKTLEAKKKRVQLVNQIISLTIGLIFPLLVSWLMQKYGVKLTTLQIGGLIALNNLLVMSLQIFLSNPNQSKLNLK